MRRIAFVVLLFAASVAYAQQRDDAFLDDVENARTFNAAAISPDGRHIAWSVQGMGVTTATTAGMDIHLLPGDGDDHFLAWSPDSTSLATVSDGGKEQRQIFVTHIGGSPIRVTNVHGYLAAPGWSPDGKSIAFIEGLMSDEGSTGGDLFVIPAVGGAARNVTPEIKASVTTFAWTATDRITFGENVAGESAIARVDTASGAMETLWRGQEFITSHDGGIGASLARDGVTSAVIRSGFRNAAEVWAGPIGEWKRITITNRSSTAAWGEARSIRWKSDAFDVQGWLLAPAQIEAGGKYPMGGWVPRGPPARRLAP